MAKTDRKELVLQLIREDTYTLSEICEKVGIGRTTLYEWRKEDRDFAIAMREAETHELMKNLGERAKESLRKLVEGYEAVETTTIGVPSKTEKDEKGKPKFIVKEQKRVQKPIPPNTAAVIFALTNTDPSAWKNRQSADIGARVEANIDANVEQTQRYTADDIPEDLLKEIATRIQENQRNREKQ